LGFLSLSEQVSVNRQGRADWLLNFRLK